MKIGPRPLVSDAVYSIFVAKEPFVYRVVPNTTNGVLEAGASNPVVVGLHLVDCFRTD